MNTLAIVRKMSGEVPPRIREATVATTEKKLLIAVEFFDLPAAADGSKIELIRGEIVKMPLAKGKHGITCGKLSRIIGNYVEAHHLGWVPTNETRIIFSRDPDTVLAPDVAYWSFAR